MIYLLILILVWNLWPFLVLAFLPIPLDAKLLASVSLAKAAVKGLALIIPSAAAPLIVPFVLLLTGWKDNKLPSWATWWDNDVSINGDREEYWPLDYTGDCYYAVGHHPRSFWARYVWLGWRNRASRLAQMLGATIPGQRTSITWGDPDVTNGHAGWQVNCIDGIYQIYITKRLGHFCYRMNWGHKIWSGAGDSRTRANVINVSFSLLRWKKNQ